MKLLRFELAGHSTYGMKDGAKGEVEITGLGILRNRIGTAA